MLLKHRFMMVAAVAGLAGCGGGGGNEPSPAPAPTAGPLSKYAGTYTFCSGNERVTMTATAASGTELVMDQISQYFQQTNCTGAVVGTETISSPIRATFQSTGAGTVTGYPQPSGTTALPAIDRVSITAPATTVSLTGSGVSVVNGKTCVSYTNGRTCLDATSNQPLSATGGLALTSTALLLLEASPNGYTLDTAYPR